MFFPDLVYINRAKNIFQETYTISEPKFRWFIFLSMKTRQFWHLIEPVKGPGEARGLSARQIFFVSSSKGHFQRLHGIFENLLYENLFSLHFSKKLSKNKNFLQHSHSGLSLHFGKKMSKNSLQKIYCMANLSAYIFLKNCPKIFCNILARDPAYILVRRCPKIYCNRSAVSQIFPPYNLVKKMSENFLQHTNSGPNLHFDKRCLKIYCNRSAVWLNFPAYILVKNCPKIYCNILAWAVIVTLGLSRPSAGRELLIFST